MNVPDWKAHFPTIFFCFYKNISHTKSYLPDFTNTCALCSNYKEKVTFNTGVLIVSYLGIYLFLHTAYVYWLSVRAPVMTTLILTPDWLNLNLFYSASPIHPSALYVLLRLVVLLPTRLSKLEASINPQFFLLPHISTSKWSPIPANSMF